MSRSSAVRRGVAVLALSVSLSASARAHGGAPRADAIVVEPGNPGHVVIRSNVGGLFVTLDGGLSWTYVCGEAYGSDSLSVSETPVDVLRGGNTLIAQGYKGLWSTTDACRAVPLEVSSAYVRFVGPLPPNSEAYLRDDSSEGFVSMQLWRVGAATPFAVIPQGFAGRQFLALANGTLFVSGNWPFDAGPGEMSLIRSDDAGAHWVGLSGPSGVSFSQSFEIVAVSPRDPARLFATITEPDLFFSSVRKKLFTSPDGGRTWVSMRQSADSIAGFAISPDGESFVFGGPKDHLLGMTFAELDASGPSAARIISDHPVWGLTWTKDALYVGTDEITHPKGDADVTLSVSHDGGRTLLPFFSICRLNPPNGCPAGSAVAENCREAYANFMRDVLRGHCVGEDGGLTTPVGPASPPPSVEPDPTKPPAPLHIVGSCTVVAPFSSSGVEATFVGACVLLGAGSLSRRRPVSAGRRGCSRPRT